MTATTAVSRMRAVFGPTHYQPTTAWGPIQAVVVLIAAEVLVGIVLAVAGIAIMRATDPSPLLHLLEAVRQGAAIPAALASLPRTLVLGYMMASSVLLLGAAWWLAKRGGLRAADVLALRAPIGGGWRLLLICVVAAIVVAAGYALHYAYAVHYAATGPSLGGEAQGGGDWVDYVPALGWPVSVVSIGIAGPLVEEVWFRGFLLPAFARTRLGFWGANLATSALFAASHALQYTPDQLVPVFLVGVVFAWVVGLTGSIWVPVALHMCINLLLLLWVWLLALA